MAKERKAVNEAEANGVAADAGAVLASSRSGGEEMIDPADAAAAQHKDDGAARLSSSVGDYLKAIWLLAGDGVAGTGEIARELGVTAPSVTAMLSKMSGAELVAYEPYRGASLTPAGRREALRLVRRHLLLEMFMVTQLGFGWDEVHQEAELMEHVVSDVFAERLAKHLDDPEFDPHGYPIPRVDGSVPVAPTTPLADLALGGRFRVHRLLTRDRAVLAYLESRSVEPGAELVLRSLEPGGNLLHLEFVGIGDGARGRKVALSRELASLVLGENLVI
ncbi:MAG: metal-dependent transcriptional regulator [Trueperaceae bacterium]|nr:metal-dependent transcriptional regulator [Trueperaceae bacterium]MCO5173744.1 metal-dependent transcriptional regulator [Trueperaceae bacterium]